MERCICGLGLTVEYSLQSGRCVYCRVGFKAKPHSRFSFEEGGDGYDADMKRIKRVADRSSKLALARMEMC